MKPSLQTLLASKDFRLLWLSQLVSQLGNGLTALAALVVINQLTGSTAAVAGMAVALTLPQLLFGLMAGVLADRWDRRRILILSETLRGLLVLCFLFVRSPDQVWIFYLVGFAEATVATVFVPAKSALIAVLVPRAELVAANALSHTTVLIANVLGGAFAGILLGVFDDLWPAFAINSLTFFASAGLIARIRWLAPWANPSIGGAPRKRAFITELREGIQIFVDDRGLGALTILVAISMLGSGAVAALFVPFLVNDLQSEPELLGLASAAQVAGTIAGTGALTLSLSLRPARIIAPGITLIGASIVGIGTSQHVWVMLAWLFFMGFIVGPVQSAFLAFVQRHVREGQRGRASGVMATIFTLFSVTAMTAAGALAEALDIRQIFYAVGVFVCIAGVIFISLAVNPFDKALEETVTTDTSSDEPGGMR